MSLCGLSVSAGRYLPVLTDPQRLLSSLSCLLSLLQDTVRAPEELRAMALTTDPVLEFFFIGRGLVGVR